MEAGNPVMDSGLIPVEPHDVLFDPLAELSPAQILELQIQLLVAFMSWLDNSSLPVTVLGSRHVVSFLQIFQTVKFRKDALLRALKWNQPVRGSSLFFSCLGPFVAGLCKAIGSCLNVSTTVLYEEEDVTTRSMNLDFLSVVPIAEMHAELQAAMAAARTLSVPQSSLIAHALSVVHLLVSLECVPMFPVETGRLLSLDFLVEAERSISLLERVAPVDLPPGTFSRLAQRYFDNPALPLPLYFVSRDKALDDLRLVFLSIRGKVAAVLRLKSISHIFQFLEYDVELRAAHLNVLARGILQLFIVRGDRTALGLVSLSNVPIREMEALLGPCLAVLSLQDPQHPHASRIPATEWPRVSSTYAELMAALETALIEALMVYASNTCRHHQLRTKSLVMLDSLQVRWEQFEFELFDKYAVGEATTTGQAAMPVSSFVYFKKLETMIKVVLQGISLDLCREYEILLVYWYCSILYDHQLSHIDTRLRLILQSRIYYIESTLPKKLKKLKAGAKKEAVKAQLKFSAQNVLPKLKLSLLVLDEHIRKPVAALDQLIRGRTQILHIVSMLGVCHFSQGPPGSLTTHERLFDSRLKPFLSIGVPPKPTYSQYTASLDFPGDMTIPKACQAAKKTMKLAQLLLESVFESICENSLDYFRSDVDNQLLLLDYENLVKVSRDDLQTIALLEKIAAEAISVPAHNFNLKLRQGHHRYFPKFEIS